MSLIDPRKLGMTLNDKVAALEFMLGSQTILISKIISLVTSKIFECKDQAEFDLKYKDIFENITKILREHPGVNPATIAELQTIPKDILIFYDLTMFAQSIANPVNKNVT